MSKGYPDWQEPELLLALDFYFTYFRRRNISVKNSKIKELSDKIKNLNLFTKSEYDRFPNLRNANSIHLKLRNFKYLDTGYDGCKEYSEHDKEIFIKYKNNVPLLKKNAILLNNTKEHRFNSIIDYQSITSNDRRLKKHLNIETNSNAITKKILSKASDRQLKCEICQFDFKEKYGNLGENYIEFHFNTSPELQSIFGEKSISERDFSTVCSNCHSMLHRSGLKLSVKELTEIVNAK